MQYDRVVNRLLESPQYGERWGRHWMDVWRYSDWWGLGRGGPQLPEAYLALGGTGSSESLNADKGYDQMLREMLAADELYPNDLDRLRARRGPRPAVLQVQPDHLARRRRSSTPPRRCSA